MIVCIWLYFKKKFICTRVELSISKNFSLYQRLVMESAMDPVKDKNISTIQNSNIKITQLEDNSQDYNNNQDYNNPAHR